MYEKMFKLKVKVFTMLHFAILLAAVTLAAGQSTNVETCRMDNGPLPLTTYIEGCTEVPCDLHPNSDVIMHTIFAMPRNVTFMSTFGALYINLGPLDMPVPYDLGADTNTCNFINGRCPLREGQIVQYTMRHHIGIYMPLISAVRLEYTIVDEMRNPIVCVGIPIIGHHYTPPGSQP